MTVYRDGKRASGEVVSGMANDDKRERIRPPWVASAEELPEATARLLAEQPGLAWALLRPEKRGGMSRPLLVVAGLLSAVLLGLTVWRLFVQYLFESGDQYYGVYRYSDYVFEDPLYALTIPLQSTLVVWLWFIALALVALLPLWRLHWHGRERGLALGIVALAGVAVILLDAVNYGRFTSRFDSDDGTLVVVSLVVLMAVHAWGRLLQTVIQLIDRGMARLALTPALQEGELEEGEPAEVWLRYARLVLAKPGRRRLVAGGPPPALGIEISLVLASVLMIVLLPGTRSPEEEIFMLLAIGGVFPIAGAMLSLSRTRPMFIWGFGLAPVAVGIGLVEWRREDAEEIVNSLSGGFAVTALLYLTIGILGGILWLVRIARLIKLRGDLVEAELPTAEPEQTGVSGGKSG